MSPAGPSSTRRAGSDPWNPREFGAWPEWRLQIAQGLDTCSCSLQDRWNGEVGDGREEALRPDEPQLGFGGRKRATLWRAPL